MSKVKSTARFRAYTIKGDTPLMMHHPRLADPMLPEVAALSELVKSRKKKGADIEELTDQITRMEWVLGMYHSDLCGPYLTGGHIKAAIRDAGKAEKMGAHVVRYVSVPLDRIPVQYDGPRDLDGMWKHNAGWFIDQRVVSIQRNKVVRTRPIFHDWTLDFFIKYRVDSMSPDGLDGLVDGASWCGIGDGRSIDMGQFSIVKAWEPTRDETWAMRNAGVGR